MLAALMLAFLVGPLLALALQVPETDHSEYTKPYVLHALRVTLVTATGAVWFDALLGVPLGFWLARTRSRWRHLVTAAVLLPLALPPVVAGLVLELFLIIERDAPNGLGHGSLALNIRIVGTMTGSLLAQMYVAAPFIVMSTRAAVGEVDRSYEDAARSLGCGPGRALEKVVLPLARRGILLGLVLGWVRCVGEFGAVSVLAYYPQTLTTLIYGFLAGSGLETAIAPAVLLAVVATLASGLVLWLSLDRVRKPRPERRWLSFRTPIDPATAHSAPKPTAPITAGFDVDIDLQAGDFRVAAAFRTPPGITAILGPSGAGKSLTLRSVAGFQTSRGRVKVGEITLKDTNAGVELPPEKRRLGYVAQRDALFEHLSVERNVAFGLWRLPRGERDGIVNDLLRDLGVAHRRYLGPRSLSGGERQRIALARALAPAPNALLLDEAFSALDSNRRHQARRLVRDLQRRTGIPVLLVTHDREDVLDLADYVVVIVDGRVLQDASTEEVFSRPATAEVASLVGISNLVPLQNLTRLDDTRANASTAWGELSLRAPRDADISWMLAAPADGIRMRSSEAGEAVVDSVRHASAGWMVELRSDVTGDRLDVLIRSDDVAERPRVGTTCETTFDPRRCCLVRPAGWTSTDAAPGTARGPSHPLDGSAPHVGNGPAARYRAAAPPLRPPFPPRTAIPPRHENSDER